MARPRLEDLRERVARALRLLLRDRRGGARERQPRVLQQLRLGDRGPPRRHRQHVERLSPPPSCSSPYRVSYGSLKPPVIAARRAGPVPADPELHGVLGRAVQLRGAWRAAAGDA